MSNCVYCQTKTSIKFLMAVYELKATDIAREVHVSDSLVRKHIEGVRYCPLVDAYLAQRCFGIVIEVKA